MDDLKSYRKNMKQLDTLINTVRIFSNDIGMKFGLQKYGVLITKKGKHVSSNGVKIKEIDKDQGHKYLGVLEAETMKRQGSERAEPTIVLQKGEKNMKIKAG